MAELLEGVVEKVTYWQEDTWFTVARLKNARDGATVTFVGYFPQLSLGEKLSLEGEWVTHPDYGMQFKVASFQKSAPATLHGMENFLGSGLIKGIGPSTAKKIVKAFGLKSLDIIDASPDRLLEIEGIGAKKAETIARGVQSYKEISRIMVFLQGYDITPAYAMKIYKTYGAKSMEVLQRNPYQMAEDIFGIGFKTADKIAQNMGIPKDSPQRVRAAILYWLGEIAGDGHVFVECEEFTGQMAGRLGVTETLLREILNDLIKDKLIFYEEVSQGKGRLYLAAFYYAERGVAERLGELFFCRPDEYEAPADDVLSDLENSIGLKLAEGQWEAIGAFLKNSVLVLTGGPGTGKTTTIKSLIYLADKLKKKVALTAPTGRAAKRMAEATGKEAKTIHRLLEFSFYEGQGFRYGRNEENPLNADIVIVDETSMVDLLLMYNFLKAVKPGTRLVLVGDVDQLPSVGAGNVLKDIINSGMIPVVRLQVIFRQAQQSMIIQNAHRINRGQYPSFSGNKDFFLIEREDPEQILDTVVQLVQKRLPAYLGRATWEDLQVLTPMRRTVSGVENLNNVLQEALNPKEDGEQELIVGSVKFRTGDKVMQMRNNYQKLVFNGDIGLIEEIDFEEKEVCVSFPEPGGFRPVIYDFAEMDELVLAYAISVHKSQGSEYRGVVLVLTTQHYMMLQRNLVYTAITRAKELVVIVGTKKALAIAVKNNKQEERRTGLSWRIQKYLSEHPPGESGNFKLKF